MVDVSSLHRPEKESLRCFNMDISAYDCLMRKLPTTLFRLVSLGPNVRCLGEKKITEHGETEPEARPGTCGVPVSEHWVPGLDVRRPGEHSQERDQHNARGQR